MSFNIDSIKWPENGHDANILLRTLFIEIIESVGMQFSSFQHDPRKIVKNYINRSMTSSQCREHEYLYKLELENGGFTRDFRNRKAVDIRIAMLLVHINEEDPEELGEQLSWFVELLGYRGENEEAIVDNIIDYFGKYI